MEMYGNWRESRKNWTQKARSNWTKNQLIKKTPSISFLEQGLTNYYGKDEARAAVLARVLFEDIYQLDVLPRQINQYIRNNQSYLAAFGEEMAELLDDLGDYSIVYSKDKFGGEAMVTPYLFLNSRPVGMPLKDFLIWYKGCKTPADVMSEWTGIPFRKIRMIYEDLIRYFQRVLMYYHLLEQKTQEAAPTTINVNVTVSADQVK